MYRVSSDRNRSYPVLRARRSRWAHLRSIQRISRLRWDTAAFRTIEWIGLCIQPNEDGNGHEDRNKQSQGQTAEERGILRPVIRSAHRPRCSANT